MQNRFQKIILIFCVTLCFQAPAWAEIKPVSVLQSADSLFEKGMYQQAEKKYDSLFLAGFYSEKSLLCAAMIAEASDEKLKTIHLFSVLLSNYPNNEYLFKLETYAKKNKLTGYELQDEDWLTTYSSKYFQTVVYVILGLSFVVLSILFFKWFTAKKASVSLLAIGVVFILLASIFNNYHFSVTNVLIKHDAFVYEGASSASKVKMIYKKGFRASLLSEGSVWSLVKVNDTEGYIKNSMYEVLGN